MKKLIVSLIIISGIGAHAHTEDITGHQLAGNLLAYPFTETPPPALSEAPEGYIPFHMEHYGRHGSRWLIGEEDYAVPVKNLEKAEKADKLTPLGQTTLDALRQIQKESQGRLGELSDKGALQHRIIGQRMAQNFPEIFTPEADLSAKSTPVVRCIISMANALEGIQNIAPGVHFNKDASMADMWFMNYDDKPAWIVKDSAASVVLQPYRDSVLVTRTYLQRLVTDQQFALDSVEPGLLPRLYWVLGNAQSHSNQPWLFEEVFSRRELLENWKAGNAGWFIHGGNSKLTNHRMPFVQRNLLARIIERTDSAISTGKPGANLRFGHDGILISLITLMELGDYGMEINSLSELENSDFRDFDIIPMGANLQLVFYRPEGDFTPDDILVKALINEKEVTMPAAPVSGAFYRWADLKKHYLSKIEAASF